MEHKRRNTERKEQYIVAIARIEGSNETVEARIRVIPEQTLFVKTTPYNDFPQIYDEDGAEFVVVSIKDYVLENASDKVSKFAKEAGNKLALARLEKGLLVDNQGVLISNVTKAGKQVNVKKKFIYTNDGVCMEIMKRGAAGGSRKGVPYSTTGIDPIKAMAENGIKAKSWTLLSNVAGKMLNVIDAAQFVSELGKGTRSLSILPGITPATAVISGIAVVGDLYWDRFDQEIDEFRINELEKCKKQGLIFVREYIKKYQYYNGRQKVDINQPLDDGEFSYHLIEISLETANRLLAGEFRTFDELRSLINKDDPKVVILLQRLRHPKYVNTIYIVESFYIL